MNTCNSYLTNSKFARVLICCCNNSVMKKQLLFIFILVSSHAIGQKDSLEKTYSTVIDGDTIPLVYMSEVVVFGELSPEAAAKLKAYYILRRDVMRTYPYAKYAAKKLKEISDYSASLNSDKEKRRYIKAKESELKDRFEADLKKLTINQGRILMKLIDRETGNTTYALVKELRGGFRATIYQGFARLIGDNMKDGYDAAGEDAGIESIVQQIEKGTLSIPAAYNNPKLLN